MTQAQEHVIITMEDYFSQTMEDMSLNSSKTLNGDDNYSTLVDKDTTHPFIEELMRFSQKLVNIPINKKINPIPSRRKGQAKSNYDFMDNMRLSSYITTGMEKLIDIINTSSPIFQSIYIDILVRFIFRERAISSILRVDEGKGNRDISYALFVEFAKFMPETAIQLINHFPTFGCFRDLNALIGHYIINNNMAMVYNISDVFVKALEIDIRKIINYDGNSHSTINSRINTLYSELQSMKPEEIKEKFKDINISMAGKWFPRDDSSYGNKRMEARVKHGKEAHGTHTKRYSKHRDILIARYFFPDKNKEYWGNLKEGTRNFYNMLMRKILSSINIILNVTETLMSANKWDMIEPSSMPSGAIMKHRMALVNEIVGSDEPRSTDIARIELRYKTLKNALEGALKGATLDSVKFANIIYPKMNSISITDSVSSSNTISSTERIILHAQFMALVEDIKIRIVADFEKAMKLWVENGSIGNKPSDPLNVIATIDVSGSMNGAGVMAPAIVLGIIVTLLSKLGRNFITFHELPTIICLHEDGDIVDWMRQVAIAPWGGSTNIDKAMECLLTVMQTVRSKCPEFDGKINHVIFTDGQFDSMTSYSDKQDTTEACWNTFAERMSIMFQTNGFAMPRTTFWNMNSKSPGFPASGNMMGLVLTEGLSHGLMMSVLGGAVGYTTTINEITGEVIEVAKITPIISFLKSIYCHDFDIVSSTLFNTGEKCFSDTEAKAIAIEFGSQYI